MLAYTKPEQRKKEESERLRGERDKFKFVGLRFEYQNMIRRFSNIFKGQW